MGNKTASGVVIQSVKISPSVKELYKNTLQKYGLKAQYFIEQAIIHEAESVAEARLASEYGRALKESKIALDFVDVAGRYGLKDMFFKDGKQLSKKVKYTK
jgi:hypothetical protein